jgi:outer membrane protein assembly factor BamB
MPLPDISASRTQLRLWPGVLAVALQWLLMFGLPRVAPEQGGTAILAGLAGALAVLIWWLFFSRTQWLDRLGVIALMIGAVALTSRLIHQSIANGMMGFMLFVYAMPVLSLALVASAMASRNRSIFVRRTVMAAAILIACGCLTLLRTDGISGDAVADFAWRWTPTAEERLLARASDDIPPRSPREDNLVPPLLLQPADGAGSHARVPAAASPPATAPAGDRSMNAEWPGFRGPARDSIVHGMRIETDWSRTPPVELWRRPIGPGWSSFAVDGDRFFTQEQRGDDEVVSAYSVKTGEPIWRHSDKTRFWESNAGAGPRATPTLSNGRVYTLGATGILNALDPRDGTVIWSRNAADDVGRKIPDWGIASSPLVVGDVVIVAPGGWLAAYDAASGKPRWSGSKDGWGYSSPHFAIIDGVAQVVMVNGPGIIGVAPSDGTVLWKYAWAGDSIVQPAPVGPRDLLVGSGSGLADKNGTLRITVAQGPAGWSVNERWMSTGLKSYFNDFVVHQGHAFGFDGSILACIDLEDGQRKWKGGRYGHGQLLLLADQNLLLVLSEDGDLAVVSASADKFAEIARVPAIEGKTWNHPAFAGGQLLVRNGQEMAAFRLPHAIR